MIFCVRQVHLVAVSAEPFYRSHDVDMTSWCMLS